MDITQVLSLVNAGFTAEEIRAMQTVPMPHPAPVPVPDPVPDPAPVPVPDPAPVPVPVPDPAPVPNQYAEVLTAISSLTAAIQANGIANSNQPSQTHSREEVLASIIKPTK